MSDQKMRDLMERMSAMTPETPDYPEHQKVYQAAPRRSGALVFAVTGLAVLALALPFVFWQGDTDRTAGQGGPSTTIPGTTTTLYVGEGIAGYTVFLVQDPVDAFTGEPIPGNPTLIPVALETRSDWTDEGFASFGYFLAWINREDSGVTLPEGLRTAIPDGVEVVTETSELNGGREVVVLDMNERFLEGAGGLLADITMLNQFIYTASVIPDRPVRFTFKGEPIEAFGSEGLSLVDPVDRDTFLDHLNPIIVTEVPVIDSDGLLVVRGRANVFEANLSWEVYVGPAALPANRGHVTATCGTGCWGDFEIRHEIGVREGDWSQHQIRIYSESARDGSWTHLVRLPWSMVMEIGHTFDQREAALPG